MDLQDIFKMLISSDYPIDGNFTVDQLTNFIINIGIDIKKFSKEEIDQLFEMCIEAQKSTENGAANFYQEAAAKGSNISFKGEGLCWWCYGTGVIWSGVENKVCSYCEGSGNDLE
jgi:hypothetical protein